MKPQSLLLVCGCAVKRDSRKAFTTLVIAVLCTATLIPLSASCFAQSAEDTVLWLQAKLLAATQYSVGKHTFVQVDKDQITFQCDDPNIDGPIYHSFAFTDITSIMFVPTTCRDCNRSSYIQFVGTSSTLSSQKTGWVHGVKDEAGIGMFSASDDDAKRIVKALQHLARLNGAKIPKDDLF